MKLYYGGFGDYKEFVVADSEEEAILRVGIKINAPFLPITVEEISSVDGFEIRAAAYDIAAFDEKPIEAEEVEPTDEVISDFIQGTEIKAFSTLRHCKKCDFTCETQGQLLAHYRDTHPKGD